MSILQKFGVYENFLSTEIVHTPMEITMKHLIIFALPWLTHILGLAKACGHNLPECQNLNSMGFHFVYNTDRIHYVYTNPQNFLKITKINE